MTLTPVLVSPTPSIDRPRSLTTSLAPALMKMPSFEVTRTPANVPVQSIVIALSMNSVPKSPGSRQLMTPPAFVCARARVNVRHGAERVHAAASLPAPETKDRVFCACAGPAFSKRNAIPTSDRDSHDPILVIVALHILQ